MDQEAMLEQSKDYQHIKRLLAKGYELNGVNLRVDNPASEKPKETGVITLVKRDLPEKKITTHDGEVIVWAIEDVREQRRKQQIRDGIDNYRPQ